MFPVFALLAYLAVATSFGSSAPAPSLVFPAAGASNVDPDPILSWRWTDDLLDNGSFETGMTPGWSTAGSNPYLWQVYTATTNLGMGLKFATTVIPQSTSAMGQLVQDFYIPADATSATLRWQQRVWNLLPNQVIGRLRVLLYENGNALLQLDNVTGSEPLYRSHTWVSRSTNLLAYAGRSLQLVIQADSYSPIAVNSWYADVDGFSFSCDNPTMPDFQIYLGKTPVLGPADMLVQTTDLSYPSAVLDSSTRYYCKLAAVREGVTNYSAASTFTTAPRALPQLKVTAITDSRVYFSFPSRLYRFYTIEQSESLDSNANWYSASRTVSGTNGPMPLDIPLPGLDVFWRLRVSP